MPGKDSVRKVNRAVISGATGTIGIALINECIEQNTEVIVLANPASKRLDRIPKSELVRVIFCGLMELKSEEAFAKITGVNDIGLSGCKENEKDGGFADVFFHLAWAGTFGDDRNNMELQIKNVEYALDAVRLAKSLGCHTFVGAGSQAEYGRVSGVLKADTPCNPENGYGIYKLKASEETRKLCNELGLNHVWPRVLSIYGPFDGPRTMIMSTIASLLKGESPALTKGEQLWDFLYSADAAKAFMAMAQSGVNGKIYPVGSGVAKPLREYVETLRDEIDPDITLGFGKVPYSDKQVMHLEADISALTADTGFVPQTSFKEGVCKTIEWVKLYEHS